MVKLVCAATYCPETGEKKKWWLHNGPNTQRSLYKYLRNYDILIGYSCVAEARSLLALGNNPLDFKWIDLFLEYRMMTNHNDNLLWGNQLVNGKVKFFRKPKPKWERTEEDNETGFKPTHSLIEATYKLTGQRRDSKEKDRIRDLILSNPKKFSEDERREIMAYCLDDVVFLPTIWKRIKEEFKGLVYKPDMGEYFREAALRGRYSAHTGIMESLGYPIDEEKTRNFSKQVGSILFDCQREINELFPEVKPFRWNKKDAKFSWNQNVTKDWIKENADPKKWMKTDGGSLSLALEAWERQFDFKHHYPEDNFGAQMVRFLKLKQSLYGFSESGGKRKNFWDSVGSDGRARAYLNIYGAQSSRSPPAASGFMFLKPAWMRALVIPKPGKYMASIDYGQQEFFLAALESGDKNMIAAYLSGDPYLFGAKQAGAIPPDGTKDTHPIERNLYKNTYLGITYGMTKYGLARKLTNDLGREFTEDDAQKLIDIFEDTFPDYTDWKEEVIDGYYHNGGIKIPCGWRMWGDNDNPRSVCNVPIQGFGASIMRKAVDIAVGNGCKVLFTLHDAIYIEDEVGNERMIRVLAEAMREAFVYYFEDKKTRETAAKIKLDPFVWSPDYKKDSELMDDNDDTFIVPCSNLYVDERSIVDYNKFSKYFSTPDTDLL